MNERAFEDAAVDAVFRSYSAAVRENLLFLRQLSSKPRGRRRGVGPLVETLKWGQPSYLTAQTGSGSMIRIDQVKPHPRRCAMYFHCQTTLVATFRELYSGQFKFVDNRSMLFDNSDEIPVAALRHCVSLALTYRLSKARRGR